MTKQFSLLQLFSIVDGRLSTNIGDVYEMLNHICDDNLMTHHLPVAFDYLKAKNPKWLNDVRDKLQSLGIQKDSIFESAIAIIKSNNEKWGIPQLKDEFDTSDFGDFMVNNSLLLKKATT